MGSMEQYKACGLATVNDQIKLRKLIGSFFHPPVDASSHTSNYSATTLSGGKLPTKRLQELTTEDKFDNASQ